MQAAGFNAATDGGVQAHIDAESAAGLTGMVWVPAYDNSTCTQTLSNTTIAGMVQANVTAGHAGLRYQIGDEPTANGCDAAPVYTSITQAVHAADPTAKTWVADDQFQVGNSIQQGVPMKGTVDILAFDVYPCETGPCDYAAIDSAVQQIHSAGVTNWEFILQDFNSSPWRWPTPAEIQAQFDHWKNQGASGYWVFAWDYQSQQVILQTGNVAALQQINSEAVNESPSPPPSPSPIPSPPPSPSPSPSPVPSPLPSPLNVSASANPNSGSAPLEVNFTGAASGGVSPYGYAWSFGDGSTSTSQNLSHSYTVGGFYNAILTVTDAAGATASASVGPITVRGPLAALAGASPAAGDAPLAVAFTGLGTSGTLPYTYTWTFGDGTTGSGPNPVHTYTSVGTFTATLTVSDGANNTAVAMVTVVVSPSLSVTSSATPTSGTAPVAVDFTGTPTGGKAPFDYAWTFGDGSYSTSQNPGHTYSLPGAFSVTLTVTDANGTSAVASLSVNIAPGPLVASAAATRSSGDAPVTTTLTGSESGGTPPYTYAWDLGDGTRSTQSQLSHTYAASGGYTATLTVTDSRGVSASAVASVTVYPAMNISLSTTPTSGDAPLRVAFSASVSAGLAPYGISWDFGDGSTGSGPTGTHSYGAGTFHPKLTIHDAAGGTWTGAAATIVAIGQVPPAGSTSGSNAGSGSVPAAGATPSPAEPTPSAEASPPLQVPAAGAGASEPPSARGSAAGDQAALGLMVAGSALASGLGGVLFLSWRRRRLGG